MINGVYDIYPGGLAAVKVYCIFKDNDNENDNAWNVSRGAYNLQLHNLLSGRPMWSTPKS